MKKNKSAKSTVIKIIVFVVIVLGIAAAVIFNILSKRARAIPEGITGNTSGNINNRGRFCEYGDYIYFANPYDDQKLYKMKSNGSGLTCLTELSAEFINVYGDEVYFYQTAGVGNQVFGLGSQYGVCKCDTSGSKKTSFIDKAVCNSLILYGPYLYYQRYSADEGLRLYKANTANGNKEEISQKEVFVSCPVNGKFYCYNTENMFYMSAYNESNDEMELAQGSVRAYNIAENNGYLYFMNLDDSYRIYRVSLSPGSSIEKVNNYKADIFNVYGNNLFYQRSSEENPCLVHMNITTGEETIVAEGNFTNINCTSAYTYFYEYGDDAKVYTVPTSGGSATVLRLEMPE